MGTPSLVSRATTVLVVALAATGCTGAGERPDEPTLAPSPSVEATTGAAEAPEPSATPDPEPRAPLVRPGDLRVATAMAAMRHLAGTIGPRHGTSPEFRRAAGWVSGELRALGYDVRRQEFPVPAGDSWGVPVEAGTSLNVVAAAPRVDTTRPHLVVGAHLDTVPQSPGAEDNASGVGTLLAVAQAVAGRRTRLPVVLVAFGAEEPRGPGDDDHHYGSRAYVAALTATQRRAVRGMVSLDRVGVGDVLPVGAASGQPTTLVRAAERAGVPVAPESGQRSSDHWSFVRAGLPGLRIGSTPYAAYHSSQDVPGVVSPDQLERAGRLVLAWLSGG